MGHRIDPKARLRRLSAAQSEILDTRAQRDQERTRVAELIASRYLRDGAALWIDGLVSMDDCLGVHRLVTVERVKAACERLIALHPGLKRQPPDPLPMVRTWLLSVGLDGFDRLVGWVGAAETEEQRIERGKLAKEAIDAALAAVDHRAANQAIRAGARRFTQGDPN